MFIRLMPLHALELIVDKCWDTHACIDLEQRESICQMCLVGFRVADGDSGIVL